MKNFVIELLVTMAQLCLRFFNLCELLKKALGWPENVPYATSAI